MGEMDEGREGGGVVFTFCLLPASAMQLETVTGVHLAALLPTQTLFAVLMLHSGFRVSCVCFCPAWNMMQ